MSTGAKVRVWGVVLLVALMAVSASAQFQTGNIYGKTVAKDGSVLPGVTVMLTGVGAPMTTVSDEQGNFRFPNLSPGSYTLKAELSGMGTTTRTGLRVGVGANADVELVLNPSMAEAITVSAEAPLLDVRKSGTGVTVDKVMLDRVPTSRDPWMILQSTPGVFVDRINVGGTQSGQQSVYISKGAPRADGTWNVDGVNITDMGATGSSPTYYDFDTFEEMQITTGGSDPRIQTSGVQMNMVTKRGTNDYSGSGRYLYVPGSTSAEASVPGQAAGYLAATNQVNYVRDYGGEVGGPLWRDKLWLWVARADQKISTWQSIAVGQSLIIPDDTILRNKNAKMNAQLFTSNSFVASYTYGDKFRNARDISPLRPYETSFKQTGPTTVYKIEDTQLLGSNFYVTGMWSKVQGGFGLFGNGGFGPSAPSLYFDDGNVAHNNYYTYDTNRPQKQYRADASFFHDIAGVSNELKFGYGYRDTPVSSATVYPGPAFGYWDYSFPASAECTGTATEACGVAVLLRQPTASYSGKYNELYLGDTVMLHNLTVQAGLRWDDQSSAIQAMQVDANPILGTPLSLPCIASLNCAGGSIAAQLPALDYPGQTEELNWTSLSPRIGLTYALGGKKRTLLRAGYNRYVSQLGSAISGSSPVGNSQYTFFGQDANGDHIVQRSELSKIRNFTGINPAAPTSLTSTRRIDYDMNPPATDEFLLGFEHELWTDVSVGATFTHRVNNDLVALRYEKTQGSGNWFTRDDFVQTGTVGGTFVGCGVALVSGQCPAGQSFTSVSTNTTPVYGLKAGVPSPTFSVITNRPDYKQTYNGVEVTATKRMSSRWMMRVNASWNDYTEDCGDEAFANPTRGLPSTGIVNGAAVYAGAPACIGGQIAPQSAGSGAFGNVFINSRYNANVSGVYVAPWDVNVGANLLYRQGYPDVLRVASGAATVALEEVGERRFDNVYQLDLRLAKDFRLFNLATFTVSADIFNATNQRTVLQRNGLVSASATAFRITEMQAPRVFRVGGKFTF
jgi:hypothetical protein